MSQTEFTDINDTGTERQELGPNPEDPNNDSGQGLRTMTLQMF